MSSSYSDSDFRALGHVGNSRGSSDVNLYDIIYHTYPPIYRYNILTTKSNFTLLMYLHFGGVAD